MRGESDPKRPGRAFLWLERTLLGIGMSMIAAVMDRVLIRTLRKGSVERAPRTAAGPEEEIDQPVAAAEARSAVLAPPPKQVADQPGR